MKTFSYLTFSDVHNGHKKVRTKENIECLETMFKKEERYFKELSLIVINGDLFDDLLPYPSEDVKLTTEWFDGLLRYCEKNDIKLRINKGTPSHDYDQLEMLDQYYKLSNYEVDFKYIDDITIEYIEDLEVRILYIPDEIRNSNKEVAQDVLKLMKKLNITSVDLTFIHGAFGYQLPYEESDVHNEEFYLKITDGAIHTGHIHNVSQYERIYCNGSVNRLRHNEEEDKGMNYCIINKDKEVRVVFVKNDMAKIFKTIEINSSDQNKVIQQLKKEIKKYPDDSYIRLRFKSDNILLENKSIFTKLFPNMNMSFDKIDIDKDEVRQTIDEMKVNLKEITPNNIGELLMQEVELDGEEQSKFWKILDEIK